MANASIPSSMIPTLMRGALKTFSEGLFTTTDILPPLSYAPMNQGDTTPSSVAKPYVATQTVIRSDMAIGDDAHRELLSEKLRAALGAEMRVKIDEAATEMILTGRSNVWLKPIPRKKLEHYGSW